MGDTGNPKDRLEKALAELVRSLPSGGLDSPTEHMRRIRDFEKQHPELVRMGVEASRAVDRINERVLGIRRQAPSERIGQRLPHWSRGNDRADVEAEDAKVARTNRRQRDRRIDEAIASVRRRHTDLSPEDTRRLRVCQLVKEIKDELDRLGIPRTWDTIRREYAAPLRRELQVDKSVQMRTRGRHRR